MGNPDMNGDQADRGSAEGSTSGHSLYSYGSTNSEMPLTRGEVVIDNSERCPAEGTTYSPFRTVGRVIPKLTPRDEAPVGEEWRSGKQVQHDIGRLNEVIRRNRSSALGLVIDDSRKVFVVVVDGAKCSLRRIAQEVRNNFLQIDVEIRASCRRVDQLRKAQEYISSREWIEKDERITTFSFLDPKQQKITTRIAVYSPEGCGSSNERFDPEKSNLVAQLLASKLGSLGHVTVGISGRNSRIADSSPHKGGAKLRSWSSPWICTSGFVASRFGRIGVVTAGHCYKEGERVSSGPFAYGTVVAKADFPKYDMEFIAPRDGESFEPRFYISNSDYLVQSSTSDPDIGSYVCVSGQRSGRFCKVTIVNDTGELCETKKSCTRNLWMARKERSTITRKGDSGALVFERSSLSEASIIGMSIGDPGSDGGSVGGDTIAFHSWRQISDILGVRPLLQD